MNIEFIGQGYDRESGSSVASKLMELLGDARFNSFKCLVAFASHTGVSGLADHIANSKSHIETFRVIVGIDQFGTSKEALEALLQWEVDSYVFYTTQRIIFHPKIYLFEGEEFVAVIIGSNNLTQTGLAQNIEGAVLITYNKSEGNTDLINQITNYYEPLLSDDSPYLRPISTDLIEQLLASGRIKDEAHRRAQYRKGAIQEQPVEETGVEYETPIEELFQNLPLQGLPSGFNPTRLVVPRTSISSPPEETPTASEEGEEEIGVTTSPPIIVSATSGWVIEPANEVLVAEVGAGSRWKQVNFPILMFENFFGATAGDNSYTIRIRHVEENSSLNEIEQRQAVTVQSSNYRFEIGVASGLTYPSGQNRPIVIFIKVGNNDFLYELFMPDSSFYGNVKAYLYSNYSGPARNLRRLETVSHLFESACPTLPIWSI